MARRKTRSRSNRSRNRGKKHKPPVCPYCGRTAECVDDSVVYGRSFGRKVWVCPGYPTCDSYVGCHRDTKAPLGIMADRRLRNAKMECHEYFDPLWRKGLVSRNQAYQMLAKRMGMTKGECHFGKMDLDTARRAIIAIQDMTQELIFEENNRVG